MKLLVTTGTLAVLVAITGMARADLQTATLQSPMYETPPRKPPRRWYGGQTLMCDAISVITAPAIIGIGGYFLAAPIVHVAHGQIGRGFADLGIRVAAPTLLAFGGAAAFTGYESLWGAAAGGLLGIVGAMAIDAGLLAYEPATDDDGDHAMRRATRHDARLPVLVPMLVPRMEGGAVFGLSGTL